MSVNRLQTTRPLLFADGTTPSLNVVADTLAGVILDIGCSTDTFVGVAGSAGRGFPLLARLDPIERLSEDELNRILGSGVDGVVLSACRGRADIQRLDVMLQVAEATKGITDNHTRLYAEYGGLPEGLLSPHTLAESSTRLEALIFNGKALAHAVGCKEPTYAPHQRVAAPILAGRANVILRASEAGVPAYEMLASAQDEEEATRQALLQSRDNGFASVVCRSIEQAIVVSNA